MKKCPCHTDMYMNIHKDIKSFISLMNVHVHIGITRTFIRDIKDCEKLTLLRNVL